MLPPQPPKATSTTALSMEKPRLTEDQKQVVFAIVDALIPELQGEELEKFVRDHSNGENEVALRAFAKAGIVNTDMHKVVVQKIESLPTEKIVELGTVFAVLSTRVGTLALGGTYQDFPSLSRKDRTAIIYSWSNSTITKLRILSRVLLSLAAISFYSNSNPAVFEAMGYPGPDPEIDSERHSTKTFPIYEFIKVPKQGIEMTFDVVIVGSGAGGGVMAAELSKIGKKVLVIEKGHHYQQQEMSLNQDAFTHMYESGGALSCTAGSTTILAGATWGGGTTVNWCASLQLPHEVRSEWERMGLPYFSTPSYQKSIDHVIERLGISDKHIKHNIPNNLLFKGCQQLGYPVGNIPQNTGGHQHSCGWCGFGCRYGEKQGTVMTFLDDARKNGAQFMQDTFVDKVLIEHGRAVGVVGNQQGRPIKIRATKVVVSAGSIHSPALLMRSGLKNKQLGQNLTLHPVNFAFGKFSEKVNCFDGSIMTAISTVAENTDGHGYGSRIEVPMHHPFLNGIFQTWTGGAEHKAKMLDYTHSAALLVLSRDRDGGTVSLGPDHLPRITYNLTKHDAYSVMYGVEKALCILVAAGAEQVWTTQKDVERYNVKDKTLGVSDPRFKQWLAKVAKVGIKPGATVVGSAHQMGTCRMGASPALGVVKPTGETWEVKDLYVADASTFPTASGVNPMLTTLSISHSIAQFIKTSELASSRL